MELCAQNDLDFKESSIGQGYERNDFMDLGLARELGISVELFVRLMREGEEKGENSLFGNSVLKSLRETQELADLKKKQLKVQRECMILRKAIELLKRNEF